MRLLWEKICCKQVCACKVLFKGVRWKNAVGKMKIAKIEYAGKADVFNMEVEDVHSFIVNGGIVSHNCYDASRYFFMSRPLAATKCKPPKPNTWDPYRRDEE